MRKFARQLDDWLKTALDDVPLPLQQTKIDRESTPLRPYTVTHKTNRATGHFESKSISQSIKIIYSLIKSTK